MVTKKIFKIIGLVITIVLLAFIYFFIYKYFSYKKAYETKDKPYKTYIGYIDQEKALLNNTYKLCDNGNIYNTYSSASLPAYAGSKKQFRKTITETFNNNTYSDSGYLNFRFLVNCEGNAGWFEIIEMNLDLEKTKLNPKMVNELLKITSNSKHWNIINYNDEARNYYMYVSYRIENGKITEIIP